MRLSQTARKLNVGTETIITYLHSKGIEIVSSPNTKITSEQLALLTKEFSTSVADKKMADEIVIEVQKEEKPIYEAPVPVKKPIESTLPLQKEHTTQVSITKDISASEPFQTPFEKIKPLKGLTILDNLTLPKKAETKKVQQITPINTQESRKPRKRILRPKNPLKNDSSSKFSKNRIKQKFEEKQKKQAVQTNRTKYRKEKRVQLAKVQEIEQKEALQQEKTLQVVEFTTAHSLAGIMNIPINKLLATCMDLGIIASINQRLDAETITIVADELGYNDVQFITTESTTKETHDDPKDLLVRAPIVTVMGHVDHGKTSLLDYIRKESITKTEAGGITQHIGAYDVLTKDDKRVVFLDTPGHEAFTAMRTRGAQITDIAIIIIGADDGVMPQTKEAISLVQLAGIPIVIAINKIDKPQATPEKVKEQLAGLNIMVEDWGGKYQCQEISAKTGEGVAQLLEKVLLEAEVLALKANPHKKAQGTVIEASLDQGRGYLSTLMVQAGTLKKGDILLAGSCFGKVKAMFNARKIPIQEALPATPVQVLGLNGVPQAGEIFKVMPSERTAREAATQHKKVLRTQRFRTQHTTTLEEVGKRLAIEKFHALNILIKADGDGSTEALADSLLKLTTENVQIKIIYKAVGNISESDVLLAVASKAIIIGFNTNPTLRARKMARRENISISLHTVIYHAIGHIEKYIENILAPTIEEIITGKAEVKKVFKVSKVGNIAGCQVTQGYIKSGSYVRFIRDGEVLHTSLIKQLKREKEVLKEAKSGSECGISVDNFNDMLVGDIIEAFEEKAIKPKK